MLVCQITSTMVINNIYPIILGFNEEMWTKYSKNMVAKFENLKKSIKDNKVHLPNTKNLQKYLFNFPGDYGGLGEILDEQKFEKLNFFEYKPGKNKMIPFIEMRQGSICVPLECRNENLNIIYNDPFNVKNFSSLNTNISDGSGSMTGVPFSPFTYPLPHSGQVLPPINPQLYPQFFYRPLAPDSAYPMILPRPGVPEYNNPTPNTSR